MAVWSGEEGGRPRASPAHLATNKGAQCGWLGEALFGWDWCRERFNSLLRMTRRRVRLQSDPDLIAAFVFPQPSTRTSVAIVRLRSRAAS